jgi:hypothetical protein
MRELQLAAFQISTARFVHSLLLILLRISGIITFQLKANQLGV